jgi:plastocyanin
MRKLSYAGLTAMAALGLVAPAVQAQGGATVKGTVVWAGPSVPEQKKLDITKDQQACLAKGPLLNEEIVVNPSNKGMANVFVWITTANGGKPPVPAALAKPKVKEVDMDQPTCAFEPHAVAVREGQTLVAKNSAPVAHNVNWQGSPAKNPGGNKIIPSGKAEHITNLKADKRPVAVSCNIHPWMKGWIRVFDHPYYAVTDKDGNFEIKDAPVGKYKIWYWSDTGYKDGAKGAEGFDITIKAGDNDQGKVQWKPAQ